MKRSLLTCCSYLLLATPALASTTQLPAAPQIAQETAAPAAGAIPLGGATVTAADVVHGWSAHRSLLGKSVKNDRGETLGTIDDIIITPKDFASFAIVGVGGFLGINERKVAIPMNRLEMDNGQWILPGASKEAVKALPPFIYAH